MWGRVVTNMWLPLRASTSRDGIAITGEATQVIEGIDDTEIVMVDDR